MVSSTAHVNHFNRWSSGYGLPPIDGRRRIESRPGHFFPAKNRDFVHGLNAPNIGWGATLPFVRGVNSSATPRYSAGVLAKKVLCIRKPPNPHSTAIVQWANSGTLNKGREFESRGHFFAKSATDFFASVEQKS